MRLDIIIPTKNRLNKLKVCLDSVKEAIKEIPEVQVTTNIYVDTAEEVMPVLLLIQEYSTKNSRVFVAVMEKEYRAARFWNSYLQNIQAEVLCYLNDDIKLDKNCLIEGIKALETLHLDGVVGFYQSNQIGTTNCNAAFGLIGSKFADRFPDRQVFCEDYYCLYLDEELMKYASSINRFIGSTKSTLEHYHPVFTKEKPDETHIHNRRYKQRDIKIYNIRKAKNLVWGKSFERVTEE